MIDAAGRVIDYMRISITDRCNLRCRYCMPDGITQVSMAEILTYEEIRKVCILAAVFEHHASLNTCFAITSIEYMHVSKSSTVHARCC